MQQDTILPNETVWKMLGKCSWTLKHILVQFKVKGLLDLETETTTIIFHCTISMLNYCLCLLLVMPVHDSFKVGNCPSHMSPMLLCPVSCYHMARSCSLHTPSFRSYCQRRLGESLQSDMRPFETSWSLMSSPLLTLSDISTAKGPVGEGQDMLSYPRQAKNSHIHA